MKIEEVPRRVHFIGCGGIGMSGLMQHLYRMGYTVSGSDRVKSDRTDALERLGIKVCIGHNGENIGDAELVVRTSAVSLNNEEVVRATERGVPVVLREELLGAVFNSFETRIAVCGTHGKTTVTAMLHKLLTDVGIDHAAFIGGVYRANNYFFGSKTVVAEACEFNRSFFYLKPTLCVCVNVEYDHPDCYKDIDDTRRAFGRFFSSVGKGGCVVLPSELRGLFPHRNRLLYDRGNKILSLRNTCGTFNFDAETYDGTVHVDLGIPGEHNVSNALAVLSAAQALGIPSNAVARSLQDFCGVDRRWTELKKTNLGLTVLDYAHHPTEIGCSVSTANSMTKGRVLCVFQPHTYTRTQAFWEEFAECFRGADAVGYLPIYSAREKPIGGVNSYLLAQHASEKGINACFLPDFATARKWVFGNCGPDDILLILGAGDIDKLADML